MSDIKYIDILKASEGCPLKYNPSMSNTPRMIYDLFNKGLYKELNWDKIKEYILWCDSCGLCGDNISNYIKKLRSSILREYLDDAEKFMDIKFSFEGRYSRAIYLDNLFKSDGGKSILSVLNNLSRLYNPLSIIIGPNLALIDIFREIIDINYIDELSKIISENGVKELIVIDKYTYKYLLGYAKEVKITPLSVYIRRVSRIESFYFKKPPKINIYILNTPYKFYRKEYKTYLGIIGTIPSINAIISRRRFGLGMLPIVDGDSLKYYINYINTYIHEKVKIIGTVDPYLYLSLYKYLPRRSIVLAYLPNLLTSLLDKF